MDEVEIEAFKAGTPASKGITAAHLTAAAAAYKPDTHRAPIVMGHPADDDSAPAFGAISGARVEGNSLFVKVKNLAQTAIDGVKNSQILNRSMAFWHPNHPSNPNPGVFSIRHLGLLGGAAPAIPNLAPLHFTADDQLVAEGEPGEAVIFGAPAALDAETIKAVAASVAAILTPKPKTEEPKGKEFAVDEAALKAAQEKLAADQAALKASQDALAAEQTTFAANAKRAREDANLEFTAGLVTAGRLAAGAKDDVVKILNALPADVLEFSADKKMSPADALKALLGGATPVITLNTQLTPEGNPTFAAQGADDGEAKALAAANAKAEQAWQGKATA